MDYSSGPGSRGEFAAWKVQVLNDFFQQQAIQSVVDFGSGDGVVAQELKVPDYVGMDVLPQSVGQCKRMMPGREFHLIKPSEVVNRTAEVALSLEVIFHLTDEDYRVHMDNLLRCAQRFLIICAAEGPGVPTGSMHYHKFSQDVPGDPTVVPFPLPVKPKLEHLRQSIYIWPIT